LLLSAVENLLAWSLITDFSLPVVPVIPGLMPPWSPVTMHTAINFPFTVVQHLVEPGLFTRIQTTIASHVSLNHADLLLPIFQMAILSWG
jgi:hypothetical protein